MSGVEQKKEVEVSLKSKARKAQSVFRDQKPIKDPYPKLPESKFLENTLAMTKGAVKETAREKTKGKQ